jgi:lysozyme
LRENQKLRFQIKLHEGLRLNAYRDSLGYWTIGYGHLLGARPVIRSVTLGMAESLLDEDLGIAIAGAKTFPWFEELTENRKFVVIDMVFNLGVRKLRRFTDTVGYIATGDLERAAGEMMRSLWFRQVGKRAERLQYMMLCDIDFHTALSLVP